MPPTTLTAPLGIGDKVFTIVRRDATVTIQCPYCGTVGTITFTTADGSPETIGCPKCEGKGKLRAGKSVTVYDVKRREIVGVTLEVGVGSGGRVTPIAYRYAGEAYGSGTTEGSADSFTGSVRGGYLDTTTTYWLTKSDAEAVAARLSEKEPTP